VTLKLAIFTAAQANLTSCPLASAQPGNDPEVCFCLGPRCMAWRWFLTHTNKEPGGDLERDGETYGFCGLAGHPELGGKSPP